MKVSPLFRLAPPGFQLPAVVSTGGKVVSVDAEGLPLFRWPDGRWCFTATSFMLSLFRQGRARGPRGGTLGTYASYISHLMRYCYEQKTDFHELTDEQFTKFMRALYDKRRADDASVRLRDASTTIAIGQVCLRLIAHAGALVGNSNLVGPSGSIFASKVNRRSRGFTSSSWHHLSFPLPSEKRVRMPLSLALIERLQAAATESSTSVYQRVRRYLMLRLLEITGGRRSEVSALTVESVRAAAKMQKPSLSLVTRKRGDNLARLVPITRHDVRLLLDFIEGPRAILIRKTCGKHRDDGYVLISSTKGRGIRPNTITQEIFALRRSAKIEEKACAHMFRHRFITKLFIALIEQHRFETDDTFRRWLISAETFKRQVLEWTGHKSAQSLDRYIHLAFNEFTGISRAVDAVRVIQSTQIAEQNLSQLEADIDAGLSVPEAISRMRRIVSDHIADFNQPS